MNKNVYLKKNVIVEPLINQWYGWSYLVSPVTAAMYIANSHLKILESFIAAPQVHASALKNPAMIGGPFINYEADRVGEIQVLLKKIKIEQAHLLKLAQAIQDLEKMLAEEAKGFSLEPLYTKVPELLKGYVELVYDGNNYPSFRLIERLLYQSSYYDTACQSVALCLGDGDTRSFVLSTPRLQNVHNLHIQIPFCDPRLDLLFKMREQPQLYAEMEKLLEIEEKDKSLFGSFFTEIPPQKAPKYNEDKIRIRYFGHACVLIETNKISILCDPLISYEYSTGIARYTYTDLPETIDYVLITHNHQDHVMFETLLQLRHKIKQIIVPRNNKGLLIDPSLKLILQQIGFNNIREIDELETIDIPEGQIIGLPFLGEHGDLNIATKTAFLIQIQKYSILCAADSNNIEPMLYERLYPLLGNIDVIFIGMECEGAPYTWAYGPLLTQPTARKMAQTRRLDGSNSEKAIKLVNQFNPQQVYIYAMGQEPWLSYITSIHYTDDSYPILESNKLIEYCKSRNIISERLFGQKEIFLEKQAIPRIKNTQIKKIKPIAQFLSELNQLDVKLWIEGDKLRCNAPKGTLNPTLKAQLQERKAEILDFLNYQKSNITIEKLKTEAVLDSNIYPQHPTPVKAILEHIFLTGATGFLGAFLLYELLQQTTATIYCLVRAETLEKGREKIKNTLKMYLSWNNSFTSRIIPIIGDLSQPLFNLSEEQFQEIAEKVDIIYHNGAWVHHTSPYSLLKATNVLGTGEVLRLACQEKTKPLHFISTISVFNSEHYDKIISEHDSLEESQVPISGYAQSKWVAEQLITLAKNRGLPVSIYRLGPISGHSQTGVFNPNDFLYRLMLGYIQLGSAPDSKMMLDIIPVDYASKAIIYLSKKQDSFNKIYHLIHPNPVSSNLLFEEFQRFGYAIERIAYEEWYNKLIDIAQHSPEHPLYSLVSLFSSENSGEASAKSFNLKFDYHNTTEGLADSSITCPPIDKILLKTYIPYLIEHKLLNQNT